VKTKVLLVDLDGVLVDFVRGSLAFHGKTLPYLETRWNFPEQVGFAETRAKEFWGPLGFDFWAGLPWHPQGRALLDGLAGIAGRKNVVFCTTPAETVGSVEGKIEWLRRNVPDMARQFTVTPVKAAASACSGRILLDDRDENVDEWRAAGGTGITVPQPWNRLKPSLRGEDYNVAQILDDVRWHWSP
jgi:hypothetical protein